MLLVFANIYECKSYLISLYLKIEQTKQKYSGPGADSKCYHFKAKIGVDVYVSLAGLDNITLLSVFLGNFNVIADLLVADLKEQFYCFIARFAFIMKTICDGTI